MDSASKRQKLISSQQQKLTSIVFHGLESKIMALINDTLRPTYVAFLVGRRYLATKTSPRGTTFTGDAGAAVVYMSKLKKQTADSVYNFTVDGFGFEFAAGTSSGTATTGYNAMITDLTTAGLKPIIAS